MIARLWKGTAKDGALDDYLAHLERTLVPELRRLAGFRGLEVLRRPDTLDVVVITRWESMDAVKHFAGDDPSLAVVPAAAQQLLAGYDARVEHYDVALRETP